MNKEVTGVHKGLEILEWVKLYRKVMFYTIVEGHQGDSLQIGVVYTIWLYEETT